MPGFGWLVAFAVFPASWDAPGAQVIWWRARRRYSGTLPEATMPVPEPRKPRCYVHRVWMAGCPDCTEQREAEREAAKQRLDQAAR